MIEFFQNIKDKYMMNLEFGKFSPEIKLGLVSASRNCFPRELAKRRFDALAVELEKLGVKFFVPEGRYSVIEEKADASEAARQMRSVGCDAAVLYLGNFSPEIEDAVFVREFGGMSMLLAAAEESSGSLAQSRGDALCGLVSASLAMSKRGLMKKIYIPQNPLVSAERGAEEIAKFARIAAVVKGVSTATIGLFGPRPRDFESCNYNAASLSSIGVEVEELGLFDLEEEIERIKADGGAEVPADMCACGAVAPDLLDRLSAYERALLNFRDSKNLAGAATQCWSRQERRSGHVPCYVNARLTQSGFPVACENDAYSLVAELVCQYASDGAPTMLDINHTIPAEMLRGLEGVSAEDAVGLFHCGNVPPKYMRKPSVKHQVIMARLMEAGKEPDITRGTLEGAISASPITLFQIHGFGDKLRAYVCEGEFLDIDPKTFGSVGVAHVQGFMRFYRNCILGRFHHHAAVAFTHCGGVIFEALKLLGVEEIYVPSKSLYAGENPFKQ